MNFSLPSLILVLSLCFTSLAPAETLTPKEQLALELLKESNAIQNLKTLLKDQIRLGFVTALKKKPKELPREYTDKALSIIEKTFEENVSALIDPLMKLFSEAYTEDELKALIAFHKSPVGRKSAKLTPTLIQQSMVLGSKWGQTIGKIAIERIRKEFKKDGVDI